MTLGERLRAALARPPAMSGMSSTDGDDYDDGRGSVPAAVLVAVTDRPEPGVLLTLRHANLRRHAGQIAFPGGRIDPGDADAVAAALREAEEEIGLPPAQVEVVGTFGRYRVGSGFEITPVVGVIPPDLPLVPHEVEVSDVFEVPLAFLLARGNHVRRSDEFGGRMRSYYEITWGERRIWGATAGLVVNLAARLQGFA